MRQLLVYDASHDRRSGGRSMNNGGTSMRQRFAIAVITLVLVFSGLGFVTAQDAKTGPDGGCGTPQASPFASPAPLASPASLLAASPGATPAALLGCATPGAGTPEP